MIATLLAVAAVGTAPQTIDFSPTDDIWVYPHASDPQKDGYLRVWGVEDQPVASDPGASDEFSYSYLKFDLAKLPKDAKVTAAVLVVFHTPDPTWPLDAAKKAPLQVRSMSGSFDEKSWDYGKVKTVNPTLGKESIFGTGAPEKLVDGQPSKFEVDLLKGPNDFRKALGAGGSLQLALTSAINPAEIGNRAVYKFFSKDWEKADVRPLLKITVN